MDIPFIIVSGSIGEDLAVQALHKGVNDYLMKDNLARLLPAIEREMQKVKERRANKQIECLLKETENSYRRLVEGVKDYGIFMVDQTGNVLSWNIGAERIMGYAADEIVGRSTACFFKPDDIEEGRPAKELQIALSQGYYETENHLVRKDGSIFTSHDVITPVYSETHTLTGFSRIMRDITERKQAEARIQQLTESLEQRVQQRTIELEQLNKELDSFTHSVSHDLRAPLRNLSSLCQRLLIHSQEQLDTKSKEYLNYIMECSQQALQLVSALLDLSKVTSVPLEKCLVDLTLNAEEILKELREIHPERQVVVEISKGLTAYGDPTLIKIAIRNLLENAWKFTSKISEARIKFSSIKENEQTIFYIQDNGAGFDPDYKNKLFKTFQRLHSVDEFYGTGVGLATVQRIIRRHGGIIRAEGAINKGATFFFTLPQS